MIGEGTMVADVLYFNQVERTRHWYTQSNITTVVEVRYVLLTGFQLQPISEANKLPTACNWKEAARKKAVKVLYQVVNLVLYYVPLGIYIRGKGTPGMFDPVL